AQRGRGAAATKESVIIEADRDSRTLMVRADAETFAKVRELAAQLDTLPATKATQRIFALANAQADSVSRALDQAFRPARGARVTPDELVSVVAEPVSNTLIVTAGDQNMKKVEELIKKLDTEAIGGARVEMIFLKNAQAADLEKVLSRMVGGAGGRGQPRAVVSADAASNALLMSGPAGELDRLMKMAMQLDQQSDEGAMGVYVLGLESGEAAEVAAMVQGLYNQQVQIARRERRSIEPLAVSADVRANALVLATSKEMYEKVSKWVGEIEKMKPALGPTRLIIIEHADPTDVQKAIDELFGSGGSSQIPAGRNPRVGNPGRGTARSGKVEAAVLPNQRAVMIRASEEDYQMVLDLVKALDKAAAETRQQVRVFALKHAANTRVAAALSGVYRTVRGARPEDQVSVSALPQTTAVLVSAAKEKMEEVAHLIEQLDKEEIAPNLEFRIYPLQHAQPTKILPALRAMLAQVRNVRPGETIDVQADERTRSIIVTAKGTVFDQVEKIIRAIDQKPAFAEADVLIVPLKNADAGAMADVLNEMLRPSAGGQVTPEARALQEQVRLLRVRGGLKEKIPELDLTKPIKISADPARPQGSNSLLISSTPDNLKAMAAIVEMLDVFPLTDAVTVRLVRLKNADALSVLQILQDIFTQARQLAGKPGTTVAGRAQPESEAGKGLVSPLSAAADMRTNTLILGGREETVALAEIVAKDLDRDTGKIVTEVRL
ncbi:MAG TPA: secretin N-terminal domain-containing protein, partial [Phycisphaerae bacterium]|nr:secretin N-terminal domain-containing protein [Phycisphaerae bacterium]